MKKKNMFLFFAIIVYFYLGANFAHPVTPTLIVERHLDSSLFGTALAAMMAVNFLFAPFWGRLCNYIPTKRIMLIGSLGYAVGQAIFGAAQSSAMVLGGRMFAGAFLGGLQVAFSNYVVNTSAPEERGKNLTTFVTVQTVASACGYFVGGMLGTISVEAAFIAQVIVLSSAGIACSFLCVDDTPFKVKPEKPLALKDANPFSAFLAARRFMTSMLALIFIVIAVANLAFCSFEQCFNYYIKDQFGLGSQYNGTFKAIIAITIMVVNSTVCNYLQKKTDNNLTFMPVVGCCAVVASAVFLFDSLPYFVGVYVVLSAVNAVRMPMLQTMVANRASAENSNEVMGFYTAMNNLGNIFGSLFAGLIYEAGPKLPFILAAGALIFSVVISVVYVGRYKKEHAAK